MNPNTYTEKLQRRLGIDKAYESKMIRECGPEKDIFSEWTIRPDKLDKQKRCMEFYEDYNFNHSPDPLKR